MSTENPIEWLEIVPQKSETNEGKVATINPTWKVSRKEVQKIGRKRKFLGKVKVSQAESQKVKQISIILSTIDKFGSVNTSKIKETSGLSWDSVIRTLKLLCDKKILKMVQPKKKVNNEKIYSLHRENAVMYHENLFFHKMRVSEKTKGSKGRALKKWQDFKKHLPIKWYEEFLRIKKSGKENISFHQMKVLVFNYFTGVYCNNCFEKGIIEKAKYKEGIPYCSNCLEEIIFEDNYLRKKGNTKDRKWKVDKEIFKIEKKYEKRKV